MKRLLDYDPLTKTQTWYESDPSGEVRIATVQDDRDIVEWSKRMARDPEYKRQGIKSDWYHCARVPNGVLAKILQDHKLSPFNKDDIDKILEIVQRDYKHCLTVNRI